MKKLLPLLSLFATSCTVEFPTTYIEAPITTRPVANTTLPPAPQQAQAITLIQKVYDSELKKWQKEIRKLNDIYTRNIKSLEDKEDVAFTLAFFEALSLDEELSEQILSLSKDSSSLPNTQTLKFLYHSQKSLDQMIHLLTPYLSIDNAAIQSCAIIVYNYFIYQKELLSTFQNFDYRYLKTGDIPQFIPPAILTANAKMLEQRDQLYQAIANYYASLTAAK